MNLDRSQYLRYFRAMCQDATTYADAEKFMPERHLGDKAEQDPTDIVFGFGRR